MQFLPFLTASALMASPLVAQDARHLEAHEHGVGHLNIAIDGTQIALELHAPGADIVGFEYGAESETDLAKVTQALKTLSAPLDVFAMPATAGCEVVAATVELEGTQNHEDTHTQGHTEFYAQYVLTCAAPNAVTEITFAYFDAFPNALEIEGQLISDSGATAFEVERGTPTLDLNGMF